MTTLWFSWIVALRGTTIVESPVLAATDKVVDKAVS